MAQGHMIPMIDMARLFAEQGVIVSLITTPHNASRFETTIHRSNQQFDDDQLPNIKLVRIPFPLDPSDFIKFEILVSPTFSGYENLDTLPSRDLLKKFYNALDMLQEPLEQFLEKANPPPSCIISDKCLSWTSEVAEKFKIPRIVFHGMCCFSLLSSHNVMLYNAHNSVTSDSEPFLVPGLPQRIEVTKAQLPGTFVSLSDLDDVRKKMREAESSAYGVVVNSFDELEHGCAVEYEKAIEKKVCLCRLVVAQLIELGLALEASNKPFIWVVKTGDQKSSSELEKWLLEERFEERIKDRGLVIKGWAPQFFNEKLIVEVLKIGVRVGVDIPVRWGEEERVGVAVKRDEIEMGVNMLMDGGEEGEKRRERARELEVKARKAMEKDGSSYMNMSLLIQDIVKHFTDQD
ncbi:hypothetical protein Dsin_006519 [Dipteronia sinensis]|uniref:Uncharacterized protein n=1 Tax=Dipteronia sinensis TaxID=43782 RepID=A0AAE0EG83_9ROSI|nr:hypothetical protein Dsin_006519 [Dipteronia sinensis]